MTYAVIDIGTTSIKSLLAEKNEKGQINIVGIGQSFNTGLKKSTIIDIDQTISAIKRSLENAKIMSGSGFKELYASIGGDNVLGYIGKGMVIIKNSQVSEEDVMRVIETTKAISNMEDEILHILPISYEIDGQSDIKNPLGLIGKQLHAETFIVAVPQITIQNFNNATEKAGYTIDDFVVQHIAATKSVLDDEEKELGVGLIDIGGGTIKLSIIHDHSIKYIDVLKVGGHNITHDISIVLRTPKTEAEKIKKEYGTCLKERADLNKEIIIPGINNREDRRESVEKVVNIIQARVEEMFDLIRESLYKSKMYDSLNTGLVLTGGGALLDGMKEFAEQKFDMPVKIGYPSKIDGVVGENIKSPEFAVAIGIVQYMEELNKKGLNYHSKKNIHIDKGIFKKIIKEIREIFNL